MVTRNASKAVTGTTRKPAVKPVVKSAPTKKEATVPPTVVRRTRSVQADPELHPLKSMIPDISYAETYVARKVAGINDLDIIEVARRSRYNTLIEGPTGSAKTSFVYAAGAGCLTTSHKVIDSELGEIDTNDIDPMKRRPVVYIPCNGAVEPSELLGRWTRLPDGTYDFVPGLIVLAVMHGGILYFDEINFLPPRIAAVAHGLLDTRRTITIMDAVGSPWAEQNGFAIKAHPDCQVIATYNEGYEGTRPLNEAFKNRFAIKLVWPYNEDVESKLTMSAALRAFAGKLRTSFDNGDLSTPISTNMLIEFEELAQNPELGFGFACENFLAAFNAEERAAVQKVLEASADNIQNDLFDFEEIGDDEEDKGVTV